MLADPAKRPTGPRKPSRRGAEIINSAQRLEQFHETAIRLHREGHSHQAISMLRRAVVANPENFRATTDFFTLSRTVRDTETINVWAARVLIVLPTHAPALRHLGRNVLDRREWRVATRILNRAILCNPGIGDDWVSLALAASSSRNIDDCLSYLNRAVCIAPTSVSVCFARGSALFNARRFAEAETQMKFVIDSGHDNPQVLFWMGRILHAQDRRAEAKIFLGQAAKSSAEIARWTRMIEATVLASDFVKST